MRRVVGLTAVISHGPQAGRDVNTVQRPGRSQGHDDLEAGPGRQRVFRTGRTRERAHGDSHRDHWGSLHCSYPIHTPFLQSIARIEGCEGSIKSS